MKSILTPFSLNFENHEERELLKQLLETQGMFVMLLGVQFSTVIE